MNNRITIAAVLVLTGTEWWMLVMLIAYMFFVATINKVIKMQRAKNSENTSPYKRVRLKRPVTDSGYKL